MATKKNPDMDVFEILKQDHQEMSQMMSDLLEADEDEREGLFFQLSEELNKHMNLEEKYFYPPLESPEETSDLISDARDEHDEIRQLLQELEEEDIESDEWLSKLEELQEAKDHHVDEEEKELFKQARKVLGTETLREISSKVMAEKEKGEKKAAAAKPARPRRPRPQA